MHSNQLISGFQIHNEFSFLTVIFDEGGFDGEDTFSQWCGVFLEGSDPIAKSLTFTFDEQTNFIMQFLVEVKVCEDQIILVILLTLQGVQKQFVSMLEFRALPDCDDTKSILLQIFPHLVLTRI